jgi:hypothetical protein
LARLDVELDYNALHREVLGLPPELARARG